MALPALNIRVPDVGGVMARLGQERDSRYRNQLLGQQDARAERSLALSETKYADTQAREGEITTLRQDAVAGEQGALQAYAVVDPDGATKLQDFFAQANEEERGRLERANLDLAQKAAIIMRAKNPTLQQQRWDELRASSSELATALPEQYDEDSARAMIIEVMAIDEVAKAAGMGTGAPPGRTLPLGDGMQQVQEWRNGEAERTWWCADSFPRVQQRRDRPCAP